MDKKEQEQERLQEVKESAPASITDFTSATEAATLIVGITDRLHEMYTELDVLYGMLRLSAPVGAQYKIKERAFIFTDNFAHDDLRWKATPFRRFELVEQNKKRKK